MAKRGTTKYLSNEHEKFIAEAFGGKTQIASGAFTGLKGDCVTLDYLIECKATEKPYYILKRKVLEKIEQEAIKCNKIPLLAVRCNNKDFIFFRYFDFFRETPMDENWFYPLNESVKVTDLDYFKVKTLKGRFWVSHTLEHFLDWHKYLRG